MKKIRRILSLLVVLALMACLNVPVKAAERTVKLSMEVSQDEIYVGDTVKLTINADTDFVACGVGMTIYYDDTALELDTEKYVSAAPLTVNALEVNGRSALRVSFAPNMEAVSFSASEPLAVINFTAISVNKTEIEMGAAFIYDASLADIKCVAAKSVEMIIEPSEVFIPVTGVTLDAEEVTLEEGEEKELRVSVSPAGASDISVTWTSSDENVVTVKEGVIKAISEGSAVITATTNDGGFTAECGVNVTVPSAGYAAEMPDDMTAYVGKTVKIPVVITNSDGKTGYNAYDIDFAYDAEVLELLTDKIPDATVTLKSGEINVLGYGEDKDAGSVVFTLEFKVLKIEDTEVKITSARVDNSDNAIFKNVSLAALKDDNTVITVAGYPITLPEDFVGDAAAVPDEDYTFSVPDDYFDYEITVTVNGKETETTDNGDGSYTIPKELIDGTIVVKAEKTGKIFKVTLGADMQGENTAQHSVDYIATIKRDESYRYEVSVTIGGKEYMGCAASGNTYTIPGVDITGDVVFEVVKTEIIKPSEPETMHTVTFTGSAAGAAYGNATSVAHDGTYTLTLKKQAGYSYHVSYQMGDKPYVSVGANADGTYVISPVVAPLVIRIEKSLNISISVQEYLTLDEKTVFLVLAKAALNDGNIFTYDGNAMYYSEVYGAWAYLVITDEDLPLDTAESKIEITTQTNRTIKYSGGDVNKNGITDGEDIELICDLYNAKHMEFDEVNMSVFLNADVNCDGKLDMRDAAAVVRKIIESQEEHT